MKTNRKSIKNATVLVFLILVGYGYAGQAFNKKETAPIKKVNTTTYYYNGPATNLEQNVTDTTNWSLTQTHSCGAPTEIPCRLEDVPEDMSIAEYLDFLGSASAILDASIKGRTP